MDFEQMWLDAQRASRAVGLADSCWTADNADQLAQCTPRSAADLRLQHALTFLIANGLITVSDPAQFQKWMPTELPPELAAKMTDAVQEGITEQAKLNAAFFGR